MNFEKTQSEGLKSKFHIVVPAADVETAVTAKLMELGKTIKMPGFRPGRVPMPVLKSRFRPQALAEAQQSAMNTAVGQLLEQEGINPAVQPSVTGEPKLIDGEDMEFDLEVEALPKVELADFTTLELDYLKVEASEEQVDQRLKELAAQAGRPAKVARNRKLKDGDIAHINFNGKVDGEEKPGMKGEGFDLQLGSGQFIPGFEAQLVGIKGGESTQVSVTFPEDYQAEELRGVEAVFDVDVLEVREKKALEVGDELVEALGRADMADLREFVADNLAQAFSSQSKFVQKRKLLDLLQDTHKFDLPPSLVQGEFDAIWQQIEADKEADRLDEEDKSKSDEELKDEYTKIAERRVALGLVLSEVTNRHNLQVTQDELNGALQREITKYPGKEQEVLKFFQENPQAVQQITAPIMEDKAVEFILEKATITEKIVAKEELEAAAK